MARTLRMVQLPPHLTPGKLLLTSMPGRYEPLGRFLQDAASAQVDHILCLVSDEEIARKSPDYLALIKAGKVPVSLSRFSIPDFGVPRDSDQLRKLLAEVRARLDAGETIVVHCAAGIGRTGMVAILILKTLGMTTAAATKLVRQAGSSPEDVLQWRFLENWG